MTDEGAAPEQASSAEGPRVLHVRESEYGFHIVSEVTLADARAAQDAADAAPFSGASFRRADLSDTVLRMSGVRWTADGDQWTAYGTIGYQGPDGVEYTDLYLEVRRNDDVDELDEADEVDEGAGWLWSVCISGEDSNFGDATMAQGEEDSPEAARQACERAARDLQASEGGGTFE